jgi:hypothetical protein
MYVLVKIVLTKLMVKLCGVVVMVHTPNPSYREGRGKRIMIEGQPG